MPIPIPGRIGEALRRSTAAVRCRVRAGDGSGSAVVLTDELVVTNAHVIRGREVEVESWEGKRVSAKIVKLDRVRDLALLEARHLDAPPAVLGDSDAARPGMPVLAIGNPLGFVGALSSGVIHATSMAVRGGGRSQLGWQRWLCADVRLAPGNSGGPLADLQGQVLGVNTMVISGGLALAVPSRSVQCFLNTRQKGRRIGFTVRPIAQQERHAGLLILELEAGGAAERASLLPGDIVTGANGRAVQFAEDLDVATSEGGVLTLEFRRGGDSRLRRVAMQLTEERVTTAA